MRITRQVPAADSAAAPPISKSAPPQPLKSSSMKATKAGRGRPRKLLNETAKNLSISGRCGAKTSSEVATKSWACFQSFYISNNQSWSKYLLMFAGLWALKWRGPCRLAVSFQVNNSLVLLFSPLYVSFCTLFLLRTFSSECSLRFIGIGISTDKREGEGMKSAGIFGFKKEWRKREECDGRRKKAKR